MTAPPREHCEWSWCHRPRVKGSEFCAYHAAPAPHAAQPAEPPATDGLVQSDDDEVICPKCVHQFRAVPVNVQADFAALYAENERQAREIRTLRNVAVTADERAERAEAERDALAALPPDPTIAPAPNIGPHDNRADVIVQPPAQGEPMTAPPVALTTDEQQMMTRALFASAKRMDAPPVTQPAEPIPTMTQVIAGHYDKPAEPPATDDLVYALTRMCIPMDDSRLSGVTAQEDARCMEIIRAHIERQAREIAELNAAGLGLIGSLDAAKHRADLAKAERDALREDAERYRWLRNPRRRFTSLADDNYKMLVWRSHSMGGDDSLYWESLDAAIDAARAKVGK